MSDNSWESLQHSVPVIPGFLSAVVLAEEGATRPQAPPQLASLATGLPAAAWQHSRDSTNSSDRDSNCYRCTRYLRQRTINQGNGFTQPRRNKPARQEHAANTLPQQGTNFSPFTSKPVFQDITMLHLDIKSIKTDG